MKKKIAIVLFLLGILMIISILYINSTYRTAAHVFAPYSLLDSSWQKYKVNFISPDGRVIDATQDSITTSEGQSYALLRAVWMNDKQTFDLTWNWTKNNLKRNDDHLFGWKWGQKIDGSYGFIENGGENSASDADNDIALALIFASERWRDPQYSEASQLILNDLWQYSTEEFQGKRYFLAGRWATSQNELIMNPSYFAPYAWRIFAQFDKKHDWNSLISPAYQVLNDSGTLTLNDRTGVGLPPNWIAINKNTKALGAPSIPQLNTLYSFDAMRVPWRIAMDDIWFSAPESRDYLTKLSALTNMYQNQKTLTGEYEHDGTPITSYESPAMYATSMGYFKTKNSDVAKEIYTDKLLPLYSNDTNTFKPELNYYEQNWVWFSLAYYHDLLPNLYSES